MSFNMTGYISSIETMGLVDGPGIRVVIFLSGCKLRCKYCHNPETWKLKSGNEVKVEDLIRLITRYNSYFKASKGGVTFSGGEPLLQPEFLLEMLKACREKGIHTAIDTCGVGLGEYDEILKYTDLVIFDIKDLDKIKYKELVSYDIDESLKFLDAVKRDNTKMWIRQLIIPGYNDTEEYIKELADFIKKLENVEKVELLPYKNASIKYEKLKMKYDFSDILDMDTKRCEELNKLLNELIKK